VFDAVAQLIEHPDPGTLECSLQDEREQSPSRAQAAAAGGSIIIPA
jgi:hypothetical protein